MIFVVPFTAAENLGFTSYPPAYLNLKAKGKNLLNGANFASGASGYYDPTAKLYVKNSHFFFSLLFIILVIVLICVCFYLYLFFWFLLDLACNFIEPAAETLQRMPEYIGGNSREVKCFVNYI